MVRTVGAACPTQHIGCLLVVLAEILKGLSEIAPKLRAVNSTRLLLFPVLVIKGCRSCCRTSVKVVLFLKDVIAADRSLPLRRRGFAIFDICAPVLLARFIVTHVLGRHFIILLSVIYFVEVRRVLFDDSAIVPLSVIGSMRGFFFVVLVFLINPIAIFDICCLRLVGGISLLKGFAAISIGLS